MFIDTLEERGMTHADFHWGDPDVCHFPLINWLQPLPLAWMFVIYLVMLTGELFRNKVKYLELFLFYFITRLNRG